MNRRHRKRRGSGFVRGLFVFLLLLLALYVFLGREERPASVPSWEPIPGETAEEAGTEGPAAEETETAGEEESSSVSLYCRSLLSDADRAMYDRILEGITSGEETEVPTLDPDALSRVYTSVMADHPEIFYTDGYTYTTYRSFGATRALSFTARYTVSERTADVRKIILARAFSSAMIAESTSTTPSFRTPRMIPAQRTTRTSTRCLS